MRVVEGAVISLALATAGAGCFSPAPGSGLPCSPSGECPAGQTCNQSTTPPTCDGVATADAGDDDQADGTPVDAATCAAGCPANAPICELATGLCRGCIADAECATGACFETNGTCVAEATVLFVAPAGAGTACTRAQPCASISVAMAQSGAMRTFIAVAMGTYQDQLLAWPSYEVVVSGADRQPATVRIEQALIGMPIVDVLVGGIAVMEGVTITGATGSVGLRCRGSCTLRRVVSSYHGNRGFDVFSTADAVVEDSRFEHNGGMGVDCNGRIVMTRSISAHNADTGLDLADAYFDITNTFVFSNGDGVADGGGVEIGGAVDSGSRFEFNTVVDNRSLDPLEGGGLECGPVSGSIAIASSIFARNSAPNARAVGTCSATYVLTSAGAVMGTGNLVADPMFVDEMAGDFHLAAGSPARAAADPAATLDRDYDGDVRPAPTGSGRDIGADEVP